MSVETASYLSEFNSAWPLGGDFRSEGDNHIRLLKAVLQNTFPNLAGRFTRTIAKSATFTQVLGESHVLYNCSATLTINLLSAATLGNGYLFCVMNSGTGTVTIDPNGAELINGASTFAIPAGSGAIVFCDGTALYAFYLLKNISPYIFTLLDDVDATTALATLCAAPLNSPAFTGVPTAPTAAAGTATTQIATTAFVANTVGIGQVAFFARSTEPSGWLKANGAAVSRTTYASLFSAIGTTWGVGDGSTTFNVPDLRGEFVRCWDDGKGTDSGRAFASFQDSENKSHSHTVPTNNLSGGTTFGTLSSFDTAVDIADVSTSTVGAVESRPRNFSLLACIKF